MPNWCNNSIRLVCKDISCAEKVYDTLCRWEDNKEYNDDSDFGSGWLGKFLIQAGLATRDSINSCGIKCRGIIYDLNRVSNTVFIGTETAWGPMINMWKLISDKCFPEMVTAVTYVSEEPACGIYLTNDPDCRDHYLFSWEDSEQDICSESELIDYMTYHLQEKGVCPESTDLYSLQQEMEYFGTDISINRYEFADLLEVD